MVLAEPNEAHIAIAQLQKAKDVTVITQNIDGLHNKAGSKLVLELHGSIYETIRAQDKRIEKVLRGELIDIISALEKHVDGDINPIQLMKILSPIFRIGNSLEKRPNLVLFGDLLSMDIWNRAYELSSQCDCFVVVGTSKVVYPAVTLIDSAMEAGAKIIEINKETTDTEMAIQGRAAEVFKYLLSNGTN